MKQRTVGVIALAAVTVWYGWLALSFSPQAKAWEEERAHARHCAHHLEMYEVFQDVWWLEQHYAECVGGH